MIAARLDRKLRDHILNSRDNLFSSSSQKSQNLGARPVLVIVDRTLDLIPMLSHSWTYQSLVHDVLKMKLNRITIEPPTDSKTGATPAKKTYHLDAKDFFWNRNSGLSFPQVAEDIDKELTRYKDEVSGMTKQARVSSLDDLGSDVSLSAQTLKATLTQLPELQERKRIIDMHMNIATALLQGINNRKLDGYYQTEENIMKFTKAQMFEHIANAEYGHEPRDRLRLFIIWFLSTEQEVTRADLAKFEDALKQAQVDTTPLAYIKRYDYNEGGRGREQV